MINIPLFDCSSSRTLVGGGGGGGFCVCFCNNFCNALSFVFFSIFDKSMMNVYEVHMSLPSVS